MQKDGLTGWKAPLKGHRLWLTTNLFPWIMVMDPTKMWLLELDSPNATVFSQVAPDFPISEGRPLSEKNFCTGFFIFHQSYCTVDSKSTGFHNFHCTSQSSNVGPLPVFSFSPKDLRRPSGGLAVDPPPRAIQRFETHRPRFTMGFGNPWKRLLK